MVSTIEWFDGPWDTLKISKLIFIVHQRGKFQEKFLANHEKTVFCILWRSEGSYHFRDIFSNSTQNLTGDMYFQSSININLLFSSKKTNFSNKTQKKNINSLTSLGDEKRMNKIPKYCFSTKINHKKQFWNELRARFGRSSPCFYRMIHVKNKKVMNARVSANCFLKKEKKIIFAITFDSRIFYWNTFIFSYFLIFFSLIFKFYIEF